jgi:metal-sulfur cluster biosynthetic enzyme
MPVTKEAIVERLNSVPLPEGGTLISADLVRALQVEAGRVRFVIEAPDAATARGLDPVQQAAKAALHGLDGVTDVQIAVTAHAARAAAPQSGQGDPPQLGVGRHPTGKPEAKSIPASSASSPSAQARAAWASLLSLPIWRCPWRGRAGRWAFSTPIFTVRASRI